MTCCWACATPEQRLSRMIVCSTCGNKRCPRATDHNLQCTSSNAPGQHGSRYEMQRILQEQRVAVADLSDRAGSHGAEQGIADWVMEEALFRAHMQPVKGDVDSDFVFGENMRKLTNHIVDGDSVNHQLEVSVLDAPGQGGACHKYRVSAPNTDVDVDIDFQKGPIKEFGVNGVTHEALLAVLIDRLVSFQAGPFACDSNELALNSLRSALWILQARTRDRIARGVEGTNSK